jgi:hypothetical protein
MSVIPVGVMEEAIERFNTFFNEDGSANVDDIIDSLCDFFEIIQDYVINEAKTHSQLDMQITVRESKGRGEAIYEVDNYSMVEDFDNLDDFEDDETCFDYEEGQGSFADERPLGMVLPAHKDDPIVSNDIFLLEEWYNVRLLAGISVAPDRLTVGQAARIESFVLDTIDEVNFKKEYYCLDYDRELNMLMITIEKL